MAVETKVRPNLLAPKSEKGLLSVAVIGAGGKIGGLFTETLSLASGVRVDPVLHGGIADALERKPEMIILATPNPAEGALNEIAEYLKAKRENPDEIDDQAQKPFTLVLPQNGVDVVLTAETVLAEFRSQVKIVRLSLFTNVSRDENKKIRYNRKKKRVALAPVDQDEEAFQDTVALFRGAGFAVETIEDYKSMEWTKLIANLWGSSSAVTGLSPKETFRDRKLFALEHRALKDRMAILEAAGIQFADIKWTSQLRLLASLPDEVSYLIPLRHFVAKKTASERNNQPSAAAEQIAENIRIVEPTVFYHKPFIKVEVDESAEEQVVNKLLESDADRAIYSLLLRHEGGLLSIKDKFDLNSLTSAEKRTKLLQAYHSQAEDVFIPQSEWIKRVCEFAYGLFVKRFEIHGKGNLEAIVPSLEAGKSVLFAPNHRAHPDHMTIARAVEEQLGEEFLEKYPLLIVANTVFEAETWSRMLSSAYSHLKVWTIKEDTSTDDRWYAKFVNRRYLKQRDEQLKRPRIGVLYMEGGRSKIYIDGKVQLQTPVPGGHLWFEDTRFDIIVPVAIRGTEKMLPPTKAKKGLHFPQMPHKADIMIRFGKPIEVKTLKEKHSHKKYKQREVDVPADVMTEVANMLPPDERGAY